MLFPAGCGGAGPATAGAIGWELACRDEASVGNAHPLIKPYVQFPRIQLTREALYPFLADTITQGCIA